MTLPGMTSPKDLHDTLWKAADKLRGSMDAAQSQDFVLGMVFLKYVSDSFAERREQIRADVLADGVPETRIEAFLDDVDEYKREGVFWVPENARWDVLAQQTKGGNSGEVIDAAMDFIMKANPSLIGVLAKIFNRDNVDQRRLAELVDLIGGCSVHRPRSANRPETCSGKCTSTSWSDSPTPKVSAAAASTPRPAWSVAGRKCWSPTRGQVYDPCCGSGGMFVQAEKFVLAHRGRRDDIAVYGQESNERTWRLATMNLAIHGISGDLSTPVGRHVPRRQASGREGGFRPGQPAVRHLRLGTPDRSPPLALRRAARGQRQLRMAAAHRSTIGGTRHHRRRPGQRIDVLPAVRRRRDPRRDGRGGPGRLHDRAAAAVVPDHPDPGLSLVPRQGQGPPGAKSCPPPRRSPVHRRSLPGD